jgi:hypothetical protein
MNLRQFPLFLSPIANGSILTPDPHLYASSLCELAHDFILHPNRYFAAFHFLHTRECGVFLVCLVFVQMVHVLFFWSFDMAQHGESQYNVEGKIGGDSQLSERGMEYAKALPKLIADAIGDTPLTV